MSGPLQFRWNGDLKPIEFASRFLFDTEKKYAIKELELLAVVWGLEHFRLYIYGKPIKLLTDHQALEPLIKRNRSNKTYSARLTRWLDRLAHFTINVSHIAGKHLALTHDLSRNPSAPPQADDVYDEEYVINNVIPHYKFVTKYGCLSNHFNQSKHGTQQETTRKANNTPKHSKTREQIAIDCLKSSQVSSSFQTASKVKIIMDARTIDNLERADKSAETRYLIARWRDIVKPGVYRQSGGRWKKYHEPKFLRNERRVIEEQLQQPIRNVENQSQQEPAGGFQSETRRQEQWTVDPFWDVDRPQTPANTEDRPGPSQQQPIPMEEGEIDSESDQDPSILEVPAKNWAKYAGVQSVQYIKMGLSMPLEPPQKSRMIGTSETRYVNRRRISPQTSSC